MNIRFGLGLLLLLLSAAAGCESPLGPGSCEEAVVITVSQEGGPVFDWVPGCSVDALVVTSLASNEAPPATAAWEISFDGNAISPPVTYGAAPEGTKVVTEAAPLVSRGEYRVSLFRIRGISTIRVGAEEFVVSPSP